MLSFRNAGDLYVIRVVSENQGLVCKSEGLRENILQKEYFP